MKIALIALLFAASAFAQEPSDGVASACGAKSGNFSVTLDKSQHTLAQPEPGRALVYFIQEKGSDTFDVTTKIGIDGAWVGANKNSSYCTVLSRASPGARAFHGGGRKGLLLRWAGRLRGSSRFVFLSWRGRQRPG